MARPFTVKTEGLAEVAQALGALGKTTGRNVMRRVGIKRMTPIGDEMKRRAPVDQTDLRDSITTTTKKPKKARKRMEVEVYTGPGRHPQAHLQEFGTVNHGPQPFARPAWDGGKDEILTGLAEDFWAEIGRAAARQAKKTARLAAKG
jgi:HK97 gp10 family phage protein